MELRELSSRIGVKTRVLRYVVEQNLVPGLKSLGGGRGNRRNLTAEQARVVGLAAILYGNGLRGPVFEKSLKKGKHLMRSSKKTLTLEAKMAGSCCGVRVQVSLKDIYTRLQ